VSYPLPAIIEEHLPIIIFVSVGLGRSTLPLAADCFLPRSLLAAIDRDPAAMARPIAFLRHSKNVYSLSQALIRRGQLRRNRGELESSERDYLTALDLIGRQAERAADVAIRSQLFATATESYDAIITLAADRGDLDRCFRYSEQARAFLFRSADPSVPASSDWACVADEAKRRNDLVIEYAVLPNRLLVWCFAGGRMTLHEQPLGEDELKEFVRAAETLRRPALERLSGVLLKSIDLSVRRNLIFIPDKELRSVSFAALIDPETHSYVLRKATVRVVPSATWYCSHPQRLTVKPVTLLALGDPAFNRQLFSSLSPLRQAGFEAMQIASLYARPTVLTASSATPGQFLRLAGKADVIHFAGHAFTDSRDPLLSALVLSAQGPDASGLLYAKDILRMRLRRSPSIVLSACATAGGAAYGRGISNVAFAFLAAGAHTVVAATAPVSDEDTFLLLLDYHRRIAAGQSPEWALRDAQLSMLDRSDSDREDISRWGLFEVIG